MLEPSRGVLTHPRVIPLAPAALAVTSALLAGKASQQNRAAPQNDLRADADGCGSFEVSWLCCEVVGFAVFRVVDAFVLAAEVVAPVGVEVAAGGEGAELEDGLGAFEAPSRACYVHSVLDDVPAGPFDYPGGDGPAFPQRCGVVQVVVLVVQVAGAFVGAGAL